MNKGGRTRLQRLGARFLKIYISGLTAFFVLLVIGLKLITGAKVSGAALYAAVFLPALPLFVMGLAYRRLLMEGDEMFKGVVIRALLTGLAVLTLVLVPWEFMSFMVPQLPHLPPLTYFFTFSFVFLAALNYNHWKTGMFKKTDDYDPWREPKS